MEYRDYYKTLGVARDASQADIKKAFRKLARKHHPDVNSKDPSAETRFKEVNEAYAVMGDAEKRKAYDALGDDWEAYQRTGAGGGRTGGPFAGFGDAGGAGGAAGFPGGIRFEYRGDPADLSGFSDFFRTFFAGGAGPGPTSAGTRRRTATRSRGGDPDLESLLGGLRMDGVGQTARSAAGDGRGVGRRVAPTRAPATEVEISLEEVANGTQRLVQVGDRRLEVRIPPGVEAGQKIRLSGAAAGGEGGPIHLAIVVKPHPVFGRDGANLTRDLPLALSEALLGSEVPVETITGRTLLLRIPPGTQSGRTFRLARQGLPHFRADTRGDLYVKTRVVLPAALDDEGKRLARQLIDHLDQPSPRGGRTATVDTQTHEKRND